MRLIASYRRAQRLRPTALVEAGGMVERGRLEALRQCVIGRHCATVAVAVLFGEQQGTEQVNRVVSSMQQACPLYAGGLNRSTQHLH